MGVGVMKGSIRFIMGFIMIFGAVGAVENSPYISGVVPLFWGTLGFIMMYWGVTTMRTK